MSDRSRPSDNPNAEEIREAAVREAAVKANKKWLMIFGKDQSPDQIVAAIKEAHERD